MRKIINSIQCSLRNRLLSLLLFSLLLLMGITIATSYNTSLHEIEEILDGHMVTNGRALFSLAVLELRDDTSNELPNLLDRFVRLRRGGGDWLHSNSDHEIYDSDFYLQLSDDTGKSVFASTTPVLIEAGDIATGFFEIAKAGEHWHVFGLRDRESGYYFFTAQSESVRKEASRESVQYMLMPFIIGTVLILISTWFAIQYGLKPLQRLTAALDERHPSALSPIDHPSDVIEIRPLILALNRLFDRVRSMVDNERRFSADASHELRSPLAGIQANLDAARTFVVDVNQHKFLNNIDLCVSNATDVTEGLLLLSKLGQDQSSNPFDSENIDILQAVKNEIERQNSQTLDGQCAIQLTVNGDPIPTIQGSPSLFSILIRNLLDNALRYGGTKQPVDVTLRCGAVLEITVRDYGPGIPADKIDRVFDRFFRLHNEHVNGTGLGLAIAQSIATYFSATLTASNVMPSGLLVTLTLAVQ